MEEKMLVLLVRHDGIMAANIRQRMTLQHTYKYRWANLKIQRSQLADKISSVGEDQEENEEVDQDGEGDEDKPNLFHHIRQFNIEQLSAV